MVDSLDYRSCWSPFAGSGRYPRTSIRRVLRYLSSIFTYLSDQGTRCRHYSCSTTLHHSTVSLRVDAQASQELTDIRVWLSDSASEWRFGYVVLALVPAGDVYFTTSGLGCVKRPADRR